MLAHGSTRCLTPTRRPSRICRNRVPATITASRAKEKAPAILHGDGRGKRQITVNDIQQAATPRKVPFSVQAARAAFGRGYTDNGTARELAASALRFHLRRIEQRRKAAKAAHKWWLQ
jgi:hypothetical protein